jgi:SAM-dependent methyltransferase
MLRRVAGHAQVLPFRDESFDCVSAVTVVQHIPRVHQQQALREMVRVLRPGGFLILLELIRGQGAHVFSHSPEEWIGQVCSAGPRLIGWFGQEFFLLDRLFVAFVRGIQRASGRAEPNALPAKNLRTEQKAFFDGLARRAYWGFRRITTAGSVWTEPVAERLCPGSWATHGVFVFQR